MASEYTIKLSDPNKKTMSLESDSPFCPYLNSLTLLCLSFLTFVMGTRDSTSKKLWAFKGVVVYAASIIVPWTEKVFNRC